MLSLYYTPIIVVNTFMYVTTVSAMKRTSLMLLLCAFRKSDSWD